MKLGADILQYLQITKKMNCSYTANYTINKRCLKVKKNNRLFLAVCLTINKSSMITIISTTIILIILRKKD